MRLLTPEQQAAVPLGQEMGGLREQAPSLAARGENGTGVAVRGLLYESINHETINDWREAAAVGCVSNSRFGEWEPFRKADKVERTFVCDEGVAYANDGVHILIRSALGRWFSRSAQVVDLRIPAQTPGGALTIVRAANYLRKPTTPKQPRSLASEYLAM